MTKPVLYDFWKAWKAWLTENGYTPESYSATAKFPLRRKKVMGEIV